MEVINALTGIIGHPNGTMQKPILGYWTIRGLGSPIRYLFVYCGIEFEERNYTQGDAPEYSRKEWLEKKHSLGLDFPNLPYLIHGDFRMTETVAIMKYICATYKPELLCSHLGPKIVGEVEMVCNIVSDMKQSVVSRCYQRNPAPDRAEVTKELLEKSKPLVSWMIKDGKSRKYLMGDHLSYVDFYYAEILELLEFVTDGLIYKEFPVLKEYRDRVFRLPKLKEYYESDRCMKRPFNNKSANINN